MRLFIFTLSILLSFFLFTSCGTESTPVYTLTTSVNGEGTITPSSGEFEEGESVTLTGTPSQNWDFEYWRGDILDDSNPITVTMDGDKDITGIFSQKKFYLNENGITIMCPNTIPGEKGIVNGIEYESVDNELLRSRNSSNICVSLVTDMRDLFRIRTLHQSLEHWDVSNVTNMSYMFDRTTIIEPIGIGDWDVSNVTDMRNMFFESDFNQSISDWDVSNVTLMGGMFLGSQFNQPIGNWDVSSVRKMDSMFVNTPFNQPIGSWNVSDVIDMSSMFQRSDFNQPIGDWDVSNVENMSWMFGGDSHYNDDSNNRFNQDISDWDVGSVTRVSGMFYKNKSFNQPIGNWNVSNVIDMSYMFIENPSFDQNIGDWDVSNVTNMIRMFQDSKFNKDISNWCVSNIPSEPESFSENSPLTEENKPVWGTCPD